MISGGMIEENFVRDWLAREKRDVLIGIDRGAEFLYYEGILPDYVVGDFDSMAKPVKEYYCRQDKVSLHRFPPVKDATDTELALLLSMELECDTIYILGATGGRMDHFWGNVQSLSIPFKEGRRGIILDSQNHISLLGEEEVCLKKEEAFGTCFSLFPLGEDPVTVDVEGAKYPLVRHRLSAHNSLCVSNTFERDEVIIRNHGGIAVLMQTRDREKGEVSDKE